MTRLLNEIICMYVCRSLKVQQQSKAVLIDFFFFFYTSKLSRNEPNTDKKSQDHCSKLVNILYQYVGTPHRAHKSKTESLYLLQPPLFFLSWFYSSESLCLVQHGPPQAFLPDPDPSSLYCCLFPISEPYYSHYSD